MNEFSDEIFNLTGRKRLVVIDKMSTSIQCSNLECMARKTFLVQKSNDLKHLAYEGPKKNPIKMSLKEADIILDGLSDDTLTKLGFNINITHPRDYIIKAIIVVPPIFRPNNFNNSTYYADKLTKLYINLLNKLNDYRNPNPKKAITKELSREHIVKEYIKINYGTS